MSTAQPDVPTPFDPRGQFRSRVKRICLLLVIALIICVTALLGTETGRIQVLTEGVPRLARLANLKIEWAGVKSPSLLGVSVEKFKLTQIINTQPAHTREIIQAEALTLKLADLNPSTGHINFEYVKAASAKLTGLPKLPQKPRNKRKRPWRIDIAKITVDSTRIALTRSDFIPVFTLQGDLALFDEIPLHSNVDIVTTTPFKRHLRAELSMTDGLLQIDGQYHEPSTGHLNTFIKAKQRRAIHANYALTLDIKTFKPQSPSAGPRPRLQINTLSTDLLGLPAVATGTVIFAPKDRSIHLDNILIDAEGVTQKVTATFDPKKAHVALQLSELPLPALQRWIKVPGVSSKLSGDLQWIKPKKEPGRLTGTLNAKGQHTLTQQSKNKTAPINPWLRAMPQAYTLSTALDYSEQRLKLSQASLSLDCIKVTGQGEINFIPGQPLRPNSAGKLHLLALTSGCIAKHFSAPLKTLPVLLKSERPPSHAQTAEQRNLKPLASGQATASLNFQGEGLKFSGILDATLSGHYDDTPFTLTHKTHGAIALSRSDASTRLPQQSSAQSKLDKPRKTLLANLTQTNNLQLGTLTVGTLPVNTPAISLTNTVQNSTITAKSTAPHLTPTPWQIDLTAQVPANALTQLPTLSGQVDASLTLPSTAQQISAPKLPKLKLQSRGRFQNQAFALNARLTGTPTAFELHEGRVSVADAGPLRVSGHYEKGLLDFQADLTQISLPKFALKKWQNASTTLDGLIAVKGSLAAPIVQANLSADMAIEAHQKPRAGVSIRKMPPQKANLFLDTEGGDFVGELTLRANQKVWGSLSFSVPRFPISWPIVLPQNEPAAITLWAQLDAASTWLTSTQEALQGEVVADIQIPRLSAPERFTGFARLLRGNYENRALGILAKDITLNAQRPELGDSIKIKGSANDGRDGKYTLTGKLPWPIQPHATHRAVLTLDNTTLGYRGALSGNAFGALALSGDYERLTLNGDITLQPTLITLDNLALSDVKTLNPDQIRDKSSQEKAPQAEREKKSQPNSGAVQPVQLDITINAPQQAYLRGQGLEAELTGEIELNGTLKSPVLMGQFSGIRGTYKIFGRKFILRDTQVQLDGNNVIYKLTADHDRADLQITAKIHGSQDNLDLNFTSTPDLPEDEIIAFLLFGKSISNITPTQAIELASALRQLRPDASNGFDPLGKTRELIQVDKLSIESQESEADNESSGGLTIGVGKYINDRVYIEFLKDSADSKSWRSNIEVEITPSLDLKTNTESGRGLSGLELQWHRDY